MNFKTILFCLFMTAVVSSCVSNNITWKTNERVKKLELGMEKDEVIGILGNRYMITSSSKDHLGNTIEVLGYKSGHTEEYKFRFVNHKLTEWNREHVPRYLETPTD